MLICFSRIVDHNVQKKYPSDVPLGGADDNFNRRIIEGIEQNGEKPILINFMPYHSYPTGKFLNFSREETNVEGRKIINVGYINIPIIKSLVIKTHIINEVKKIIGSEDNTNILIYDFYPAFLNAAIALKRWNLNIKNTLIAPTLPSFDVPRIGIKEKISRIFSKHLLKKGKQMDSFVFLTEYMNEVLNHGNKPYTVIEGIIPDERTEEFAESDNQLIGKKYVLYSGRLDRIYSIDKLVKCFEVRKDDLYLVLCGIGDYVEEIKKKAKENEKIIYLGFKDRAHLNSIQRDAMILVNPRSPKGIYTRYSFPSKTMEYLLTGKPVVMHKLPGIPDEYDKYLNYINIDSVDSINETISKVYKNSIIAIKRALEGRKYVSEMKTAKEQASKVIMLFSEMEEADG